MTDIFAGDIRLQVARTWDGVVLPPSETAVLSWTIDQQGLRLSVDAPYYGDPAPLAPAGDMDGLWNYEVVELFLVGPGGRYLEIELGPHGHYLALLFGGVRRMKRSLASLAYSVNRGQGRWCGSIQVDRRHLPLPVQRANAFAIHGQGAQRRYVTAFPLPGTIADFHQPLCFPPLADIVADQP